MVFFIQFNSNSSSLFLRGSGIYLRNEHFSVLEEEELGLLEANSKWLGQIIITDFKADMRFSWIINLRRKDLNQNFFYF